MLLVLLRAVSFEQPSPTAHKCPSCPQTTHKLEEDIVKPSWPLSLVILTPVVVEMASWCVREMRKGQCPAAEHIGDTPEQQEAPQYMSRRRHHLCLALWTRDISPNTQSLSEDHLLIVRGRETKEEILTTLGNYTICLRPLTPLLQHALEEVATLIVAQQSL